MLTPEEAVKVLEAVAPRTARGLRDRAILELLYSTGMRKGELVALNVDDFSFERHELAILKSKSKRGRVVPVGEYARQFTEAYLKAVAAVDRGQTKRRRPSSSATTAAGAWRCGRWRRSSRARPGRAGSASTVTPHTFRHSMATHLLRNHADLRHIQAILGHAKITSTELYTHVALEDLKEVVRRAHPHGRRK